MREWNRIGFGLSLLMVIAGCGSTATPLVTPPDMAKAVIDCVAHPMECGVCTSDADCVGSADGPRCFQSHCVACLPANDNCPMGSVCASVNGVWTCVNACAGNADCNKLGGGSLCCNRSCVNPALDVNNCGGCGNVCKPVSNGSPGCSDGNCIVASCYAGYADCDKASLNGCEIDINKDPANCGACGTPCKPFANGLPVCNVGRCSAICAPGYSDCNADVADGCEIDTTFDVKNCGGCGRSCSSPPNGDGFCEQGKCSFRCKVGFADCDGNPANGCEVDNTKDSNHCGHCGNICPIRPNAMGAACTAGQCTNICLQGFGDCDNNSFNGCESNFDNALNACGGCGKICSGNNATPTCAKGMCTLVCKPGYVDCNMDTTDGCEAQLLFDAKNCGACGNACPQNNPFCINGICSQLNTKVLIIYSSSYEADVKAKLVATNAFTAVDEFNASGGTPTLQQLQPYGSVLVYSDSGFSNSVLLGDTLADYFDQGGYVVIATFANASVPIGGRFANGGYMLIQTGSQEQPVDSLGVINEPNSPLVKDFKVLTATSAYRSTGGAINGGVVVAAWNSGKPLIVRGVVKGKNVVSLNCYPPSNGARADFITGDVGPLLRNALLFR